MGFILNSNVVSAGERRGHTVRQILEQFRTGYGEIEVGLSVVTILELAHGRDVPVYPVTIEIAMRAGLIEGEQAARE